MATDVSSYVSSKFGLIKFFEVLAVEHPDVRLMVLHPGVVATDMYVKSGMEGKIPLDTCKTYLVGLAIDLMLTICSGIVHSLHRVAL